MIEEEQELNTDRFANSSKLSENRDFLQSYDRLENGAHSKLSTLERASSQMSPIEEEPMS